MISSGIGPFAQGGLDEAFGLAVGSGRIGFSSDVFEAELFAGGGEGVRGIARPVIGHDPFDGDAEASVIGEGAVSGRGNTPAWMQAFGELSRAGVERRREQAAERRAGSAGSRSLSRDRPARFSTGRGC